MTHPTTSPSFRTALALAGALALTAGAAGAQAPAPAPAPSTSLAGTWRLATDPAQAQTSVTQSVEPALVSLRPDLQQFARSRIAESTWVPSTITITATPARIAIDLQGSDHRTFDTAPNQPENVYSRSGVRAQLTQTYRPDGGLQQQFVALDGTQWNVLLPAQNGQQMVLDVTLRSQRFAQDIHFRLTYVRAR